MQVKVISDIHCDINSGENDTYNFLNDFVICCGDISGNRFKTEKWIKNNLKQGIIVACNHLGYDWITNNEEDTLDNSIKYLQETFKNTNIHFLENNHIIINNVVFVGCTLFTDFKLYDKEYLSKMIACRRMNDYRYVKIIHNKKAKLMSQTEQILRHNKSIKYIESICKKFSNRKIIVITHHAPNIQSVKDEYKKDLLSAAYASNLDELIIKYPNIKLWCHGHVHHNVKCYALRGNLTKERIEKLTGRKQSCAIGDGGLLSNLLIKSSNVKKIYDLGVVPHYADVKNPIWNKLLSVNSNSILLDTTLPPKEFLRHLCSCKTIVSTAMHPLIASDALGIPNL